MPSLPPIDRAGFPILERRIGKGEGRPLVYLDSAATALVPERVVRAVERFYATSCANIHRGAHALAEEATDAYECAREDVARFFGVQDAGRVVLTHGATESMHLAAFGWAEHALAPGDVVAVAEDNHHANVVCWHQLARRRGVEVAWIPVDGQGRLDYAAWCAVAERGPKLVALAHQSNVLGFRQPALARIMDDARGVGACIVLDGAQAAGHEPFAFDEARVDFYALSAHKMMGLTGIGALLCSERAFARMEPVVGGGGMVERVDREGFVPASGPAAYEAGTPAIAAAVAWREALALLGEAGLDRIAAHTRARATRAAQELRGVPGVTVLGDASLPCESLASFVVDGVHPHDVGRLLDAEGVAARAGHHCAQPLHRALGAAASVRASFAGYSCEEDVDALVAAVALMADVAGGGKRTGTRAMARQERTQP